jgi:hydroxyacylglutathione hydrolase
MMRVKSFTGGVFGENGYVATCESSDATVVIDPGASAPDMVSYLVAEGLTVQAILLTHAHLDHVEGLGVVRDIADALTYLHPLDRPMFDALGQQAAMFGMPFPELDPPEEELTDGEVFTFGECNFDVVLTPGHAPGHVMFVSADDGLAFSGDLVFMGSIGRTDLPGGNYQELFASLRSSVLTLPDKTRLLSGHGPETTVGRERISNPFLSAQYGAPPRGTLA